MIGTALRLRLLRGQFQVGYHPLLQGQVTDDPSFRKRICPYRGRDCQNLILTGQFGVLKQVYHLNSVVATEMCLAYLLQAADGKIGPWSVTSNVKSELPGLMTSSFCAHAASLAVSPH